MGVKNIFFAIAILLMSSVVLGKISRLHKKITFPASVKPVYRYFNGVDHFYTADPSEIGTTTPGQTGANGYRSEGIAFYTVVPK